MRSPRTNAARDKVWAKYHDRTEKALFDQLWAAAVPSYPKSIAVTQEMVDRVANFVNETTPTEPLEKAAVAKAWTNEYAAKALASLGR